MSGREVETERERKSGRKRRRKGLTVRGKDCNLQGEKNESGGRKAKA
jgi:hypothetical protein